MHQYSGWSTVQQLGTLQWCKVHTSLLQVSNFSLSDDVVCASSVSVFGQPFIKGFALLLSDRCLSCLSELSVILVYCGQTAEWIKIPLGTKVGLGPGHIVLYGDEAPPQKGAHQLPNFSAHIYCGQTVAHLTICWALLKYRHKRFLMSNGFTSKF